MSCLEKDPDARPKTARQLASALGACPDAWNEEEARAWWHQRGADSHRRVASGEEEGAALPIDRRERDRAP
jgi:hypothetical protein